MPQAPNIQNNLQYVTDGLEQVSNSDAIVTRDGRGNITLTSGSATNQAVIIENNYDSYINRSVVNATKTRFEYFTFPATRFYPSASVPNLDGIIDPALEASDQLLTARYTLAYTGNNNGFDSELFRINTSYDSTWYTNGNGVRSGFRRLPLVGPNQQEEGAYIFTPEIIKLLRDTGRTLKFDIRLEFIINPSLAPNAQGNFTQIDNTSIVTQLNRSPGDVWRSNIPDNQFRIFAPAGNPKYPFIQFQYIVDIENDIIDYDKFTIAVVAGNLSWASVDGCFWSISPIPVGSEPTGFNYTGITAQTSTSVQLNNSSGPFIWNYQQGNVF